MKAGQQCPANVKGPLTLKAGFRQPGERKPSSMLGASSGG